MKRSKHSLSHYRLTTLNQGEIYPVACEEILPGDSFRHQSSVLIRVSPLVAPVMHPVHAMIHHWYVPTRLLWSDWENFITGKDPALVVPTMAMDFAGSPDAVRLAQSLGVGADGTTSFTVSSLAFRAYNLIYNEFYRDQDLTTPLTVPQGGSGTESSGFYAVRRSSWEKDYFTTARPQPQQGAGTEVVQLSLSGEVPVRGIGVNPASTYTPAGVSADESDGVNRTYARAVATGGAGGNETYVERKTGSDFPNVRVDLAALTGGSVNMDINAWRQSMAMQRMREHRNRFGSRYRDLLAFLGVNSSDARLQRPEYLGGGKQTISFSEVLSTADTGTAVVGEMAGHGIAALRTRPYKRFFEEHGYLLSFLIVRPQSVYQNRVPRHFLRRDYEQYWQKELEMMGDQAITNFEVYGNAASPSGLFGYIPRYDEYRHAESFVSGEFRSLLDYWHMARVFASQPALNAAFVECDPTDRIYASSATDELYAMVAHRISARRLVSKFARN